MHGLYPLFHRTFAFYFSRNGTKFTAYRSSLRTDVKKGLFHKDISPYISGKPFFNLTA